MSQSDLLKKRLVPPQNGRSVAKSGNSTRQFLKILGLVAAPLLIVAVWALFLPRTDRVLTLRVVAILSLMMGTLLVALWRWRKAAE